MSSEFFEQPIVELNRESSDRSTEGEANKKLTIAQLSEEILELSDEQAQSLAGGNFEIFSFKIPSYRTSN